jgi:endonuclease/exonuclease/phosphatase family metal-dependent hydrolase
VLSYNVHGLRDDRSALASVVRRAAPDIVIVQEAPRRFRWRYRCAELAHSWDMLYAAGGLPSLGNLIVTTQRVRVRDTWCRRYSLTPGRHLRGAAFARCSIGDATFVVAGTHLATDAAERPGQARAFVGALAAVTDPIIVGVDVNETADGESWRVLADRLTDAVPPSGVDGAAGPKPVSTFPAARPSRRIDAVFVDPRCTILAYDVVTTPAARAASDHLPVIVDVHVPT